MSQYITDPSESPLTRTFGWLGCDETQVTFALDLMNYTHYFEEVSNTHTHTKKDGGGYKLSGEERFPFLQCRFVPEFHPRPRSGHNHLAVTEAGRPDRGTL